MPPRGVLSLSLSHSLFEEENVWVLVKVRKLQIDAIPEQSRVVYFARERERKMAKVN